MSIAKFVTSQFDQYELDESFKSDNFVNSIDNQNLHLSKNKISLKAIKPHKNRNSYDKTVCIQMWQFYYENNEKCEQVIDSLMKCFPYDCAKIKYGIDQSIKVSPSIWIFTDREIFVAKISCKHVDEKWEIFKKDFANTFAEKDSKIIVTECEKLIWKTKEEIKNAP